MDAKYSAEYLRHATDLSKFRDMPGADGHARITGSCGDTIEIWLRVRDDAIIAATYVSDGCGNSRAATGKTLELATGKTVDAALMVNQSDVITALGDLEEEHCAVLAVRTLKAAIADYFEIKRQPWKKAYR